MRLSVLIFVLLICWTNGNIWDNLFSRLDTKHRITLPGKDQFEVAYKRMLSSYIMSVDFEKSQKLLLQLDMAIGDVYRQPIVTAGLNFTNRSLTILLHTRSKCTEIELPKTLEVAYHNNTYGLSIANPRTFDLLLSAVTAFDHSDGDNYVYRIDWKTQNDKRRKLQASLSDFTKMQQMRSEIKGLLGGQQQKEEQGIDEDSEDGSLLGMLGSMNGEGGVAASPMDWLLNGKHQELLLKFKGALLNEIDIGTQKLILVRKPIEISLQTDTPCSHENWSNKTAEQILSSLQSMVYQH